MARKNQRRLSERTARRAARTRAAKKAELAKDPQLLAQVAAAQAQEVAAAQQQTWTSAIAYRSTVQTVVDEIHALLHPVGADFVNENLDAETIASLEVTAADFKLRLDGARKYVIDVATALFADMPHNPGAPVEAADLSDVADVSAEEAELADLESQARAEVAAQVVACQDEADEVAPDFENLGPSREDLEEDFRRAKANRAQAEKEQAEAHAKLAREIGREASFEDGVADDDGMASDPDRLDRAQEGLPDHAVIHPKGHPPTPEQLAQLADHIASRPDVSGPVELSPKTALQEEVSETVKVVIEESKLILEGLK